jgi:hypothetical protein
MTTTLSRPWKGGTVKPEAFPGRAWQSESGMLLLAGCLEWEPWPIYCAHGVRIDRIHVRIQKNAGSVSH